MLSYFPENGRKQTVPFSQIAQNHDTKEVSRLFLSCLMLVNICSDIVFISSFPSFIIIIVVSLILSIVDFGLFVDAY